MGNQPWLAAVIAGVVSVVVAIITAYVTTTQGRLGRTIQRELANRQERAQESLEATRIAAQTSIANAQFQAQRDLEAFKNTLQVTGQEADRRRTQGEERNRYWTLLREAANDLEHRIRNIREQSFGFYFAPDQLRRDVALKSSFYRFARYWGAVESVYRADPRLDLEGDKPRVLEAMTNIGRTFASDRYGEQFMVWREEQRAIGELVRGSATDEDARNLMGFASFVRQFDDSFASWFAPLLADLSAQGVEQNPRLAELEVLLGQLVKALEPTPATEGGVGSTATAAETISAVSA